MVNAETVFMVNTEAVFMVNTEMVFMHIPYMKNISNPADFFKSIEKGIIDFVSEVI